MPVAHGATITAAAETANRRDVSIQLTDAMRKPLAGKAIFNAYISTDADGIVPVGFVADDVVPTLPGAGELLTDDDSIATIVTNMAGQAVLRLTNASDQAKVRYLHLVLPSGQVLAATELQFVDNTP